MQRIRKIAIMISLSCGFGAKADSCFRLGPVQSHEKFQTVSFYQDKNLTLKSSLGLNEKGLVDGEKVVCPWSLNGGSGTKDNFSLDGGIAVPILNPACEKPFSNKKTGNGFGDWSLLLCGTFVSEEVLRIKHKNEHLFVPKNVLRQWARLRP